MHDGRTNESVKRSRPLHRRWIDSSPTKGRQTFSPTFASFTSDHRPSHVSAKETEHPAGMPRLHSPSTENLYVVLDDFYLYSVDSLSTLMDNHAGILWSIYPKMYLLERQWECALTEIALSTYSEQKTALIYVCLDIVEESYVRETFLPILCSLLTSEEDTVDLEFNTAYYMRLRHQDLNRVRIFIRDDRLNPCLFKIDRLYCTLYFRRRRWVR